VRTAQPRWSYTPERGVYRTDGTHEIAMISPRQWVGKKSPLMTRHEVLYLGLTGEFQRFSAEWVPSNPKPWTSIYDLKELLYYWGSYTNAPATPLAHFGHRASYFREHKLNYWGNDLDPATAEVHRYAQSLLDMVKPDPRKVSEEWLKVFKQVADTGDSIDPGFLPRPRTGEEEDLSYSVATPRDEGSRVARLPRFLRAVGALGDGPDLMVWSHTILDLYLPLIQQLHGECDGCASRGYVW